MPQAATNTAFIILRHSLGTPEGADLRSAIAVHNAAAHLGCICLLSRQEHPPLHLTVCVANRIPFQCNRTDRSNVTDLRIALPVPASIGHPGAPLTTAAASGV